MHSLFVCFLLFIVAYFVISCRSCRYTRRLCCFVKKYIVIYGKLLYNIYEVSSKNFEGDLGVM